MMGDNHLHKKFNGIEVVLGVLGDIEMMTEKYEFEHVAGFRLRRIRDRTKDIDGPDRHFTKLFLRINTRKIILRKQLDKQQQQVLILDRPLIRRLK